MASGDRGSSYAMLPVDVALDVVLAQTKDVLLGCERVALEESLGRTLGEDVLAPCDLPQFPASMKDGYCLHINDEGIVQEKYEVIDTILAGCNVTSFPTEIKPTQVYKIMTGAPVPSSCNVVVMIEHTTLLNKKADETEDSISIQAEKLQVGVDIRPVGSDVKGNEVVLKKGETIGATEIGLLASCGIHDVSVYHSPCVGIMSTGDELVDKVTTLQPGQIFDSNRPMLKGLIQQFDPSIRIHDCGIVEDEAKKLYSAINSAFDKVDILITSGGVSMGEVDLVKKWMEDHGDVHFGRVLMKPGKPLTFATLQRNGKTKLMFATPGNPVSSYVTSVLFVLPCLRALTGKEDAKHPIVQVQLRHSIRLDPQRPEYHRATVWWDSNSSSFTAQSTGSQASSRLLSMRSANSLLMLPQSKDTLQKGDTVSALLIGSLPGPSFVPPAIQHQHHHHHHC